MPSDRHSAADVNSYVATPEIRGEREQPNTASAAKQPEKEKYFEKYFNKYEQKQ